MDFLFEFRENLDKKDLWVPLVLLARLVQVESPDRSVHPENLVVLVNLVKEADPVNKEKKVQSDLWDLLENPVE